jgi:PD-(D/E)XK nuclease superfamily
MAHDFEPLSAKIIEAAITVHRALGPGFLESIYHGALRVALSRSGHFAQVKSYLSATGLRVGLLINFNASTLVVKRVVLG